MRYVFGMVLAMAVSACSDPSGPTEDQVDLSMESAGEQIQLVLQNNRTSSISFACGGLTLERETEAGWEIAWSPSCVQHPRITVPPGGEGTAVFTKPETSGRYRAAARYRLDGGASDRTVRTEPVSW